MDYEVPWGALWFQLRETYMMIDLIEELGAKTLPYHPINPWLYKGYHVEYRGSSRGEV